jgi:hypothetical protein
MTPAERIQSYAESPGAFRHRWRLSHFHFRWSSWLSAALLLAPLAWIAWSFGDLHGVLKGALAVMALIAVLPLARDFRRSQCVLCDQQADQVTAQDQVITACHHCRVYKVEAADTSPLPL